MKLLLFGGTFDPPHIGHVSILKNAIAAVQPDKVIVMPAATPPHKHASETPATLRMQMCECFRPLFSGLEVSNMEMCRGGKSYTVDTVKALQEQDPGADIFLCIGSDMLLTFTEWRMYREILSVVTLVVQNRSGSDATKTQSAAQALRDEGGQVIFASGEVEEISSTQLRDALSAGQNVWEEIPSQAAEVIVQNALYLHRYAQAPFTTEQVKELAKQKLSPRRYRHVANVVAAAKQLACQYGASEDKAELAAWLHDIVKESSRQTLLQILNQDAIMAQVTSQRPYPVWHGPAAAVYAKAQLGINDKEVLSAVAAHTTGKSHMSKLDKILFLADMISKEREYPGVELLRILAQQDLDKAVLHAMKSTIEHVQSTGNKMDEETWQAYQSLQQQMQTGE